MNVSKTKIMVFKAAGRSKKLPAKFKMYKGAELEVDNQYTYLGIPLPRNALGNEAARCAVNKAGMASGAALIGLSRLNVSSWRTFAHFIMPWLAPRSHMLSPPGDFFEMKILSDLR